MKKILSILAIIIISLSPAAASLISAQPVFADIKSQIQTGIDDAGGANDSRSLTESVSTIVNVLLFLVGLTAVVVIIYAGFQYITAAGDSSKTKNAQSTITYAVIGLVVAILAYAIVNFVVNTF